MNVKICLNCQKTLNSGHLSKEGWCDKCYKRNKKYGDPNYYEKNDPSVLTTQQHNVLIGSMLGDGHLKKSNYTSPKCDTAALRVKRSYNDFEYLKWEANIFSNILSPIGISYEDVYDEKSDITRKYCIFTTKTKTILNNYYDNWYKNKVKFVPNDLKLNAEIIAIWFCDDGSIEAGSSPHRFRIMFSTNCFLEEEVIFLKDLLEDRYNEVFYINRVKKSSINKQLIIRCADAASRALISDIDPIFPPGMQRKRIWDLPEARFYENQPPRRESSAASSAMKKEKIVEWLKDHDEFYLMDLTKFIGDTFTRNNGTVEWDTQNTKRYLKKYVEDGILVEEPRNDNDYKKGIKFRKIK